MIKIDYCGYHAHNPDRDLIFRPTGTSSYLFLVVLSPMTFYYSDQSVIKAKTGACILYSPGSYQHYQADKNFFNSYVHFYCEESIVEEYSIQQNKLFYPYNTEELNWMLKKIYQEFINRPTHWEHMVDLYLKQLLTLLYRGQQQEIMHVEQRENIYPKLLAIRGQMLGSCHHPWTVEELCKMANLGKSQLYKYYNDFFHSSPKEELIQARLQKVKYLMSNEAVSIKQAAYESGFQNICHFNRLFKLHYGCTPGEYRKGRVQ